MRLLTISSLYPNARMHNLGIFVENRLRRIAAAGIQISQVVAPVPWFPSTHPAFGSYAGWAAVPSFEERHGIRVAHPCYPMVPKVGFWFQPWLVYMAVRDHLRRQRDDAAGFDLIDAQYYYPDGVAAHWLARDLGLPYVVTARGTDINLVPRSAVPRRMIQRTARHAAASIAVCAALKDELVALGAPAHSVTVLHNGVDLDLFHPGDRDEARLRLDVDGKVLLSVGHLIERKGHALVIGALPALPQCTLLIAGGGPERVALTALAQQLGVAQRVRFLGELPHADLPQYYRAADALVLASSREGCANVLIEALACGTPVVATPVWGTPELVAEAAAGRLCRERTSASLVSAIAGLLAEPPDRAATRRYAERFSWDRTIERQVAIYHQAVHASGGRFN